VRLLPLTCGWGTAAVLLHNQAQLPPWAQLSALAATWGSAIAAAGQHDGARRMGEELAEANRALAEAQDRLLQSESMARLGEMAAGAAHEMNNPLAVISGRSQLLSMSLPGGSKEQKAAQQIFEQSHRLSDLITSLRMFADPPAPKLARTDMNALLSEAIKRARAEVGEGVTTALDLQVKNRLPEMEVDAEQITKAVAELIVNAMQAQPRSGVRISAQVEPVERNLIIQVIDDGVGMDGHTLAHAKDPFFSAKPAGRRIGMGLTRAQQLAAAHDGWIDLRSTPGQGTTAALVLPIV
jgi:signal transduction histidine kinase